MNEFARYFVSPYTDGPMDRWNVIDRQTQEWIRRFSSKKEAEAYAQSLEPESGMEDERLNALERAWTRRDVLTDDDLPF
jgi:hypothetical protein